ILLNIEKEASTELSCSGEASFFITEALDA
ncbi:MAG: hypothetical protein K0Q73_7762, partial [Paenibacillus sp.]|nr:hypothetical protein [Paenibacillus sp.]